jgi:hypothetical protein
VKNHLLEAFRRGLALASVAACTAAALTVSVGTAAAADCPPPPAPYQPFLSWSDTHSYVLTTGGSFEKGSAPWSLGGGAAVVNGNAPNKLDPATDSQSLYLPAGSSATSACVTAPKIVGVVRFFARSSAPGAQLKVEILVKGGVYQAGVVTAGSGFAPSPMLVSNAPAYSGAVTYQVRLTALGGDFNVDDVYFDPYSTK